jgi:glycosyltransferase involved in cell wall biosynthesis
MTSAPKETKMPVVSVVLVVRNVERYLSEAIESILVQYFDDFEFVVVDFGSTDQTGEIVAKYAGIDARIRLHQISTCGLAVARNAACSLARGTYIAIMDADDVSLRDRLKLQVEYMEGHSDVGVLGGAVEWINSSGQSLRVARNPVGNAALQATLFERCPIWQPSVMIRREAFVAVGGYREAFAPAEDYELWLRIAERYQVANLEEVVLRYRIHSNQISIRKIAQQNRAALAARLSAQVRRKGAADPLNGVEEITPEVLARLGISEAMQEQSLAREYLRWIRNMYDAGEDGGALNAVHELAQLSRWRHADRWVLSDIWLTAARLYRRRGNLRQSLVSFAKAIIVRPVILLRPLKPVLSRLRSNSPEQISPPASRWNTRSN